MAAARKRYRFRPAPLPTIAAAALMGLFIALGIWQLNRAQDKQAMLMQYEVLSQRPPIDLRLPVEDTESWRYRRVAVVGHFDGQHQFLLDNQISHGQVGYHVLTPFKLTASQGRVLVDRGWIPLGANRNILPGVTVTKDEVTLEGTVYVPYARRFSLGDMDVGEAGWPLRVQFVDFEQMAERLGAPLADMIIRLDPESPYGYRREWQIVPFSPIRHLGYAVQWLALAATLLVIYVAVTLKASSKE